MAKFAKIIEVYNEIFLIKKFTRLFKRKIGSKRKNRFSFVLTGGTSPIKLYKYLAKNKKIPWWKIDFFIGDERCVKENSKHSNIKSLFYSTVTDFAKFLGLSISQFFNDAT